MGMEKIEGRAFDDLWMNIIDPLRQLSGITSRTEKLEDFFLPPNLKYPPKRRDAPTVSDPPQVEYPVKKKVRRQDYQPQLNRYFKSKHEKTARTDSG
jgi:hypothetical protein